MKAAWLMSFLSILQILNVGCNSGKRINDSINCRSQKFQDSLLVKYSDNGAEKLPYYYNNPVWGSYFDTILSICPNVAAAYQLKAVPAIKNGEYAKAYALDKKAAELDPAHYLPYLAFLKCIFTKDYSGAIIEFKKANMILPGGAEMDHNFSFYLGLCYLELRNYKEAEAYFNTDIFSQNHGDSTREVHFNSLLYMGITKLENARLDSAEIYLKRSICLYQQLPEANFYLARVYKKRNELKLERKYLEIAKTALTDGYSMNEDNLYYVNYPKQITMLEINQALIADTDKH